MKQPSTGKKQWHASQDFEPGCCGLLPLTVTSFLVTRKTCFKYKYAQPFRIHCLLVAKQPLLRSSGVHLANRRSAELDSGTDSGTVWRIHLLLREKKEKGTL